MFCKLYLGYWTKALLRPLFINFTAVYVIKKLHLFCSVNASLSVFNLQCISIAKKITKIYRILEKANNSCFSLKLRKVFVAECASGTTCGFLLSGAQVQATLNSKNKYCVTAQHC